MPAVGQSLPQWMGDTHIIAIPIKDGGGNNVDLTGASGDWWMAKSAAATGTDVYIKKSSSDPTQIQFTDDGTGLWTMSIKLLPEDSSGLKAGTYYHEARVTDSAGNIGRVSLGPFVLNQSVLLP